MSAKTSSGSFVVLDSAENADDTDHCSVPSPVRSGRQAPSRELSELPDRQYSSVADSLHLKPTPLTREAFSSFGDVLTNPSPATLPHNTPTDKIAGHLPCGAVSANQGSAIQYRQLGFVRDLYSQAASKQAATPRVTMFVSGARDEVLRTGSFQVKILERHPFTTQTFTPLSGDGNRTRYLVIVAPSLPPSSQDEKLPIPAEATDGKGALPGRGFPDLSRVQAFIATGRQAVTYGVGTWHAPMVALGEVGTAIDFVVTQFANDVPVEDCQEVVLEGGSSENGITVRIGLEARLSKL
ncbi:Ureidoglycolate lyase [Neopestalotiopsis sp. 37M]|nr:Ureidoglycolate lyase [Neopestalotiopsis sp. 37M]